MKDWIKVLDVRIQNKSPPTIFSLASLGFGGNLSHYFLSIFPPSYWDQTNTIQRLEGAAPKRWSKYTTFRCPYEAPKEFQSLLRLNFLSLFWIVYFDQLSGAWAEKFEIGGCPQGVSQPKVVNQLWELTLKH